MNNEDNNGGLFNGLANVLSGTESIKFEIQFEGLSIALLCGGALLVGIMLIIINRKMK